MWQAQPRRLSNAASNMSWLITWPPKGSGPGSLGRPQLSAKAAMRMIALCPQKLASAPDHQSSPAEKTGPYSRAANCCQRANSVSPPTTIGMVWSRPTCGWRSIAAASRITAAPAIRLSASSTIM